ncbi:unnamed protein product [Didymodactylos carnosus]|uniref:Evolutionarily conserved signaling intermediate in Toll pathway, mitochondrial n=1 Tax=Didymodactylos carnosus TaxID=1234261 RepID=A0A814G552_9BILA|nr:unnamed protein product [Didymodactylos carnosus]CAF0989291.1 unnamed protein product [Didymodactylos carnosus]CAF3631348.1 unnamed protein product [Didymodactylos carnosus]CAF3761411.1 unnamed protein product [Didymodactylos carnosus]
MNGSSLYRVRLLSHLFSASTEKSLKVFVNQSKRLIQTNQTSDKDKENEYERHNNKHTDDRDRIENMIGPYISSNQIAFHTNQFDSQTLHKNRQAFFDVVDAYKIQFPNRRGHVEFIRAAMKRMKDFKVETDVEAYKKLLTVFPVGPYRHTSNLQVSVRFWPKQNETANAILSQMEDYGIHPDLEVVDMLREIFGPWAHPVRKFARYLYWAPKFMHKNPYPMPWQLPNNDREIARLVLKRMTESVDVETQIIDTHTISIDTDVAIYFLLLNLILHLYMFDLDEQSWLMYTSSPSQNKLLLKLEEAQQSLSIEGPFTVYIRKKSVQYLILRADATEDYRQRKEKFEKFDTDDVNNLRSPFEPESTVSIPPSVHEMDDGFILSICILGTQSEAGLNCWIKHLQESNKHLLQIPVVNKSKLLLDENVKNFYTSNIAITPEDPELIIPHTTARLANLKKSIFHKYDET